MIRLKFINKVIIIYLMFLPLYIITLYFSMYFNGNNIEEGFKIIVMGLMITTISLIGLYMAVLEKEYSSL